MPFRSLSQSFSNTWLWLARPSTDCGICPSLRELTPSFPQSLSVCPRRLACMNALIAILPFPFRLANGELWPGLGQGNRVRFYDLFIVPSEMCHYKLAYPSSKGPNSYTMHPSLQNECLCLSPPPPSLSSTLLPGNTPLRCLEEMLPTHPQVSFGSMNRLHSLISLPASAPRGMGTTQQGHLAAWAPRGRGISQQGRLMAWVLEASPHPHLALATCLLCSCHLF